MPASNKNTTEDARQEELLRSREEVRRSHALLQSVAEGTPDAIYVKSPEGRYIMVNSAAARVAGVSRDQMVGRHDYEVFPPEVVSKLRQHDQTVMSSGEAGTYEEVVSVQGESRTFLSTKAPYRDPDGHIIGVIGISQDITNRKKQEERLQFLMEASEFLYGPLEGRKTLNRLAHVAVPYVADWAVIHLVSEEGMLEQTAVAHLDPEKEALARELARRYPPDPAKNNPLFETIRTGQPMIMPHVPHELLRVVAEDEEHLRILEGLGLRSVLIVPLIRPERVLGTISLATSESGRIYGQDDLLLGQELARRAALAIENEMLYLELKEVAATFQKSLLPPRIPEIEGVKIGAVYLPAGTSVGGDFFDIFDTGSHGWVVTMGDICGKGVESAAITAAVRYTLRAVAMQKESPAEMLKATNDALFSQIDEFRFFTMICTLLEPSIPGRQTRRLTVASGGHPPPMVLRANGKVETVISEGTLLGVFSDPLLADVKIELEPGDSLLLYTDGALRERAGAIGGEDLLRNAFSACGGLTAVEMAAKLEMEIAAIEKRSSADDTALLVLQVP